MNNPTLQILKELSGEFINVVSGNVWNKVGLSLLLLGLAAICILSPIVGLYNEITQKPISFYIIGGILIVVSLFLVGKRWREIKEKLTNDKPSAAPNLQDKIKHQ